jgi:hypothetical protein
LAICCLLAGGGTAWGFDPDTHYDLTYYLARKVGFSPKEAQKIASADNSVDFDGNPTQPFAGTAARAQFHAFDAWLNLSQSPQEQQAARQNELWQQALKTGNPGVYLHYLQDRDSHDGLGTWWGQVFTGSAPDYLGYNPIASLKMARATVAALQTFRYQYYGKQGNNVSTQELAQLLAELSVANPVPRGWTRVEADERRARDVIARLLNDPDGVLPPQTYLYNADGTPQDPSTFSIGPRTGRTFGYDPNAIKTKADGTTARIIYDNTPKGNVPTPPPTTGKTSSTGRLTMDENAPKPGAPPAGTPSSRATLGYDKSLPKTPASRPTTTTTKGGNNPRLTYNEAQPKPTSKQSLVKGSTPTQKNVSTTRGLMSPNRAAIRTPTTAKPPATTRTTVTKPRTTTPAVRPSVTRPAQSARLSSPATRPGAGSVRPAASTGRGIATNRGGNTVRPASNSRPGNNARPASNSARTRNTAARPAANNTRSRGTAARPAANNARARTTAARPASGGRPSTSFSRGSSGGGRVSAARPATSSYRPSSNYSRPTTSAARSTSYSRPSTTSTSSYRPSSNYSRPSTSSYRPSGGGGGGRRR